VNDPCEKANSPGGGVKWNSEFSEAAFALRAKTGGADRIRTCDLLIANETLYQLSYDPDQLSAKSLNGGEIARMF
jgi:hypothetical protein